MKGLGGRKTLSMMGPTFLPTIFQPYSKIHPKGQKPMDVLFQAVSEQGLCKVICFSPRHDLTVPEMTQEAVCEVVDVWQKEFEQIGQLDYINYVQIFENKGSVMGCSNPHPHGQIWASRLIPVEPMKEQERQKAYFDDHGRTLLGDYLDKELEKKERLIYENPHFVVLSPYWAVWPFEAMIMSRRAVQDLTQLTQDEKEGLADAYRQLTIRYDNLFEVSFPYSAGLHQAPCDGQVHPEWHLHMHFYPPLLRSATVKKFMVGYEMLATPQRDITPETSARRLRETSPVHFKAR
jgi:UDPglucose--hexose-1-phosphate uridylyltransferase